MEINDYVRRVTMEMADQIDRVCQESLNDPEKRGVLVTENRYGFLLDVVLESKVPHGHIYILRKDIPLDGFVRAPTQGGRRT